MAKKRTYYQQKVQRARQKYSALLANPEYQEDVLAFRKKWHIPTNGLRTDADYAKWKKSCPKKMEPAFYTDVQEILKAHKIDPRRGFAILHYCLYNNPQLPVSMLDGVTIETGNENEDNYFVRLIIGPDTTLQDIKHAWSFVDEEQKKLASWKRDKFQPYRNFERDKYIYKLRKQGIKLKDVAERANKKYKPHVQYFEISKIVERYKKKIGTT